MSQSSPTFGDASRWHHRAPAEAPPSQQSDAEGPRHIPSAEAEGQGTRQRTRFGCQASKASRPLACLPWLTCTQRAAACARFFLPICQDTCLRAPGPCWRCRDALPHPANRRDGVLSSMAMARKVVRAAFGESCKRCKARTELLGETTVRFRVGLDEKSQFFDIYPPHVPSCWLDVAFVSLRDFMYRFLASSGNINPHPKVLS